MYVVVGVWRKNSPDSLLILPDAVLAEAVATNNANKVIPDAKFDPKIIGDFVAARGLLIAFHEKYKDVRQVKMIGDANSTYICAGWESADAHQSFLNDLANETVDELFDEAAAHLAQLFDFTTYRVSIGEHASLDDLTLEYLATL